MPIFSEEDAAKCVHPVRCWTLLVLAHSAADEIFERCEPFAKHRHYLTLNYKNFQLNKLPTCYH